MASQAGADTTAITFVQRSRQVWIAIFIGLVGFVALCGAVSWGLFGILGGLTDTRSATVQALSSSGLSVQRHNSTQQEIISGTTTLQEGDVVVANKDGRAFVSLFGDSGSIQMYYNSQLELDTLRTTRFFQNSKDIEINLHAGTIEMVTGELGDYSDATYVLSTGQAEVDIAPGSKLRVQVEGAAETTVTQVVVNVGHATVRSHGTRIDLAPEQMASIAGGSPPQGPMPAQENLIRNGTFEDLPTSSNEYVEEGGLGTAAWLPLASDSGSLGSQASVEITDEVNLKAAVITGEGASNHYVRVGMTQDINKPAAFFDTIELSATVKLVSQAVPAGGPVEDVYPLTIRIVYTDQFGKNHDWKRSFYFEGPRPDPNDASIIKITQGRWTTTHEIDEARRQSKQVTGANPGLFVLKSPGQSQDIAVINTIEVYGYGTQFSSWITNISLMAR